MTTTRQDILAIQRIRHYSPELYSSTIKEIEINNIRLIKEYKEFCHFSSIQEIL